MSCLRKYIVHAYFIHIVNCGSTQLGTIIQFHKSRHWNQIVIMIKCSSLPVLKVVQPRHFATNSWQSLIGGNLLNNDSPSFLTHIKTVYCRPGHMPASDIPSSSRTVCLTVLTMVVTTFVNTVKQTIFSYIISYCTFLTIIPFVARMMIAIHVVYILLSWILLLEIRVASKF